MGIKHGMFSGLMFFTGFLIIILSLLIMFSQAAPVLASLLIAVTFLAALGLLSWFLVDLAY
jgi:VIT1/CCC1 family predicted Fe2+/Mn2+ transporter